MVDLYFKSEETKLIFTLVETKGATQLSLLGLNYSYYCDREKATKHSKKPEIAYKILEELFPETKKIEIFARNERLGWDSFGDELGEIGGDE